MTAPRGLRRPDVLAERRAMLESVDRVQPLRRYLDAMVERQERLQSHPVYAPEFDPAEAGVEARVLVLLEAPGPMTDSGNRTGYRIPGSGFISVDNDDATAANAWRARDAADLDRDVALHWNAVPWLLGPASTKPSADERRRGAAETERLMRELPDLRAVVLCGRYAQAGWRLLTPPDGVSVIETWHPSGMAMARPGRFDELVAAFAAARRLAR